MFKFAAGGIGLGFGLAAWRNLAPLPATSAKTAVAILLAGLLCAYVAGRIMSRGGNATAIATATAEGGNAAVIIQQNFPGSDVEGAEELAERRAEPAPATRPELGQVVRDGLKFGAKAAFGGKPPVVETVVVKSES